ncbi:MAG: hypothetical protein J5732_09240 [Bacteroidaceae bacterium]|nr:hypothetical protein [Bacteroidaceae bacterium]
MGKIVVKAQQQNVFNLGGNGEKSLAYVLRPVRYSTMGGEDIIDYCTSNSSIPRAFIGATISAVAQCIENFLLNGHNVQFPGLGTFSITTNGVSETDTGKAGVEQVNQLKIRFLPCVRLKDKVNNVSLECAGIFDLVQTYQTTAAVGNPGDPDYVPAKTQKTYIRVDSHQSGGAVPVGTGAGSGGSEGHNGQQTEAGVIYSLTLSCNSSMGSVSINGGEAGGNVTQDFDTAGNVAILAEALDGYHFVRWSDGNTRASREVSVEGEVTMTAEFAAD